MKFSRVVFTLYLIAAIVQMSSPPRIGVKGLRRSIPIFLLISLIIQRPAC